jgi:hypothetical protein
MAVYTLSVGTLPSAPMVTRVRQSSTPRRRTPKTPAADEAAKAKLAELGQKAVAAEVKRLDKARDASAAAKKKAKDPNATKLTPEQHRELKKKTLDRIRTTGHSTNGDGSGNAVGGARSAITAHKLRLMATTGMTPLEFLTAVYRDQLYQEYDVEIVDEAKGLAQFYPKMDPVTGELATAKVELKIEQRIAAATSAAPYVHRKKPIGIDGGEGKPLTVVTADRLAQLSNAELDNLLQVFGKLGVGAEFEGGAQRPYGIEPEDNP